MAKKPRFDTSFNFGANRKPGKSRAKGKGGRKKSGVRVWKGQTYGS